MSAVLPFGRSPSDLVVEPLGAFGTERLTPTQQAANDAFEEAVRLRNANPDAWASLTVTE